jgi:hypothetical protein
VGDRLSLHVFDALVVAVLIFFLLVWMALPIHIPPQFGALCTEAGGQLVSSDACVAPGAGDWLHKGDMGEMLRLAEARRSGR